MKKLSILLILMILAGCEKDAEEKYFNPDYLTQLDLADLPDFWNDPSGLDTAWYVTASFENYPAFLKSIRVSGEDRGLAISVFETDSAAIRAMETRRNTVACVILPGSPVEMENTWWYSACIPHMVFINQWNTIIEVWCYHEDFSSVEDLLMETGREIRERIEAIGSKNLS